MENSGVNNKFEKLFELVKEAREACAGSRVKEFKEVIRLIRKAESYCLMMFSKNVTNYDVKLYQARILMQVAKQYSDRLKPDDILCQLCNNLKRKIESK